VADGDRDADERWATGLDWTPWRGNGWERDVRWPMHRRLPRVSTSTSRGSCVEW